MYFLTLNGDSISAAARTWMELHSCSYKVVNEMYMIYGPRSHHGTVVAVGDTIDHVAKYMRYWGMIT